MKTRKLAPGDRELLRLVQQAAFSNPFSDERGALDRSIGGEAPDRQGESALDAAVRRVTGWVDDLRRDGAADLRMYSGEDRELVSSACLFAVYHRSLEPMDDSILAQVRAGDEPVAVPFARKLLAELTSFGFAPLEARTCLAVFYQLRRAYYFVDRSLVGSSASMRTLRRRLWDNIFTSNMRWYMDCLRDRMEDFATLLLGETGTGKGAAAASIGRSAFIPFDDRTNRFAESFTRNFIAINLSQYPEALIESELFGHRKGAFTGAIDHHDGILGRCSAHGAIFLDEIGDVSIPVQIKLLRVLEEREFTPVGSHEKRRFQGRIIAATNRDLSALRREGLFRDDFYYRLCSDCIEVPPLRRRIAEDPGEFGDMLRHILGRLVGPKAADVHDRVRERLLAAPGRDYAWPGNVRELEQAVRRVLLGHPYAGDPSHVPDGLDGFVAGVREGRLSAEELLDEYCGLLHGRTGSFSEAARVSGLDRRTVKKHVEKARFMARPRDDS